MEKLVEIGILFDFYGKLLTEKQYSVIELYYVHDLTLVEIADDLNITRQGVFDTLKRAESKLYQYEESLALVNKFYSSHDNIRNIIKITEEIVEIAKEYNSESIQKKALIIQKIGKKVLDSSREVI